MTYRVIATFEKSTTTVKTTVEANNVIEAEKKAERKVKSMFMGDELKAMGRLSFRCREVNV